MIEVKVELGERAYPVLIGEGARHELSRVLPPGVGRAAVVTQAGIEVEVDPGVPVTVFEIGDGEEFKRPATVESLCRGFVEMGLTRSDVVIGVGGGLVTDVAGFAAATYHRGVPVLHVATTLLGQIDAAIGGKTGVNLPEGKNLMGAYWQPSAVLCDTETLRTLPPRHMAAGLGELAKYHFLGGGDLDQLVMADRVAECVRIKAGVVASDEREGGRRALLNYGHTLAHALEITTDHALLHGEAVGIGLVYAAEVAQRLGRIDASRVAEHRRVLGAYDLSTALPEGSDAAELVALFSRDKKALDGLTMVLDGPDGCEVVDQLDPEVLIATLADLV